MLGTGKKSGSHLSAGNVPRFYFYTMKELSIFIDESGDFGAYDYHSPLYIFTLLFHDQGNDISQYINSFIYELELINYGSIYFHSGPIIRRENEYKELDIKSRRKMFNKMSFFANHIDFKYAIVSIDKKHINNEKELSYEICKQMYEIINDKLSFFQQFDKIKVYYDNGQKQLTKLLIIVLNDLLVEPIFRFVKPHDYTLFQVADFISTLELINIKFERKIISQSEKYFFGEYHDFYRSYYKKIDKKKL